jgi:hypothetical protein
MIGIERELCVYVICLQLYCYSILVMLYENCVDRTRKNVVVLVQSILQLNRSSFPLFFSCVCLHAYIHHQQLIILASSFFSFVVIADGVERNQASTND